MNGTTALIILNIAIIGIIAIIIVKLYYRDESKDKDIKSLRDLKPDFLEKRQASESNIKPSLSREPIQNRNNDFIMEDIENNTNKVIVTPDEGVYKVEKVVLDRPAEKTTNPDIKVEYPDRDNGTISIKKDIEEETIIPIKEEEIKKEAPIVRVPKEKIEVKHTVERITPKIRTIKTPETSTSELKDLFTIDELIKESKRKDNERNKKNKGEDREESIIKDSISKNRSLEVEKTDSKTEDKTSPEETAEPELKAPVKREVLQTPTPKDSVKDDVSVYTLKEDNTSDEEEYLDLDYRKDLNKIKNVFKKSKVINNVKNKIASEPVITEYDANDEFIRTVDEYEEEPIISRHPSVNKEEKNTIPHEKIREQNTRKVFNMAKNTVGEAKTEKTKETPSRNSINMVLNNSNVSLKKNDEIIFLRNGDSYSSKVFDIKGEAIYVKYRGKIVSIRTSDIKKIY